MEALDRDDLDNSFENRMSKSRALKKWKDALPSTPNKRVSLIASYIEEKKSTKSPTVTTLKKLNIVTSKKQADLCIFAESLSEDVKTALNHSKSQRKDDARKTISVLTSAINGKEVKKNRLQATVARKLGLPPKTLSKGRRIRTTVLKSEKSCWTFTSRRTRSDALSEDDKKTVFDFWLSSSISRPSGNKKDIKRVRMAPNIYSSHMVHVLEKTQTEAYIDFKVSYPNIKISQRKFESLKPYYVRSAGIQDKTTCCCRYHVEARSLFRTCMDFRKAILRQSEGEDTSYVVYSTLSELVNETLCLQDNDGSHSMECLGRSCEQCGVDKLALMPEEIDDSDGSPDVKWERYEYKDTNTKGTIRRKLMLVNKTTKAKDVFSYFLDILKTFPAHHFRANWQNEQLKQLKETLPANHCILIHDFSENYRCFDKTEIQSSYFQRTEVSLHVTIIHRHAILEVDGEESTEEHPRIITEQYFAISPDESHDIHFTHAVRQKVTDYLQSISADINVLHEFTDGCQSQYKSRHCLGDFSYSCDNFGYSQVFRNFFETSHAKGPQDAAGGFIKRQADCAVLRGRYRINCAEDLYDYAQECLQNPHETSVCKRRIFVLLPTINRNVCKKFKPIPDNRSIHQVRCQENGTLHVKTLSCYSCDACVRADYDNCSNTSITGNGRIFRMVREGDVENGDPTPEDEEDSLKDMVSRGCIFAVLADDPDSDYYLLKASGQSYVLESETKDKWGVTYPAGTEVIRGAYFKFVSADENVLIYKLLKRKSALVPAVAIRYIGLELSISENGTLLMPQEIHRVIMDSL